MIKERFSFFVLRINAISKYINKLKFDFAPCFGIKNVHIFWIYELHTHPEGLTASELASRNMISRSLISREIEDLLDRGYIQMEKNTRGKRISYNSRITLTESGKQLALSISKKGLEIQNRVSEGVSEHDLIIFYNTMEKMYNNLKRIAEEDEQELLVPADPASSQES
ncbi:MAG: MarR family transcriptional regulator [Clostridia bacterium]|nr:MarR family transcriptional regulator [Clostridia bacterium]